MNCLKYHEDARTKHFYDNIFENGAIPIINSSIWISEHSASLTENILLTDIFNNNFNITSFKEQLSLLHWRHIDFNGTVNEIYDMFLRTVTDIYDASFPIREYILKDKDIKSP